MKEINMKKDEKKKELRCEKVYDGGGCLPIYKVDVDLLREQDINARVMEFDKFAQLVSNIQAEGHLESLPLCTFKVNEAGNRELLIISGHHRIRAARKVGLRELDVLVIEKQLTESEIRSKQLSHNSLNGQDDEQLRRQIYMMIEDLEQRIKTGLNEKEIEEEIKTIKVDEVKLEIDYEMVNLCFLPHQKKEFEDVLNLITSDDVYVADIATFKEFKEQVRKVVKKDDIRSISNVVTRMCQIVKDYYENKDKLCHQKKA